MMEGDSPRPWATREPRVTLVKPPPEKRAWRRCVVCSPTAHSPQQILLRGLSPVIQNRALFFAAREEADALVTVLQASPEFSRNIAGLVPGWPQLDMSTQDIAWMALPKPNSSSKLLALALSMRSGKLDASSVQTKDHSSSVCDELALLRKIGESTEILTTASVLGIPFRDAETEKKVWNWVKTAKSAAAAPNAAEFAGELFATKKALDELWDLTSKMPDAPAVFDTFRLIGMSVRAGRALNYGEIELARAENMAVRPAVETMKPQFECHAVTALWCAMTGASVEGFLSNSLMISAVAAKIGEIKKKHWKQDDKPKSSYQGDWGGSRDAWKTGGNSRDGPWKKGDGKGKGGSRSKAGSGNAASPFPYMSA